MNVFISLQRLLVRRTNLLGTASNTSLEVTQLPVLDPTQLLSLNCFVLGDDLKKVFTVKIEKTRNVSILKDLIKEEKAPHLNHVDASDLDLFGVSLPRNGDLDAILQSTQPLDSLLRLSHVFPRVEESHLHILILAPTNESPKFTGEEERRDQISALHKKFETLISRILKATAPADSAKSSVYTKSQIAYSIYDGRYPADKPRTSVAPPIQLFHPVFGHFLDDIKSSHDIPDDMILRTTRLFESDIG